MPTLPATEEIIDSGGKILPMNNDGAIKNVFQNIFKLPFRQDTKTTPPTAQHTSTVPPTGILVPLNAIIGSGVNAPLQGGVSLKPSQNYPSPSLSSSYIPTLFEQQATRRPSIQHYYPSETITIIDETDSDSNSDADSSLSSLITEEQNANNWEKKIFSMASSLHAHKHQTQQDALRHGGIVIQKLKVRKGGIAIAGPGGVATAGSGGTAIVGPGGYALAHPRSLTIAGPGAKVIAIPANVSLRDALERTNLDQQILPQEGRIVATGPTVYYAQ